MRVGNIINIVAALALSALPFSCAKEVEEDPRAIQERILKAYINTNYPGTLPTESGLYIVDSTEGTGRRVYDTAFVSVDYTIRYIDGSYDFYCSEEIAKQLGTYKKSNYYGPKIWNLKQITPGIVEVTSGIKEGGSRKAVIPPWLLNYSTENALAGRDGSIRIYDIKVEKVIDDIAAYETGLLKEFADRHYPKTDSTEFGYYFIKTHTEKGEDTVKNDETVYFKYIGKFLDGKIFDTNIADTAKKYGFYNGNANSYGTSSFIFKDDEKEAMEKNSYVKGFSKTLWRLQRGEKAVTFFYSDLGYGASGEKSIPGYMPLFFEIWVEKKKD